MNEDEIKLREYLIILNEENPTHKRENVNFSIINLFEKQQKEIEDLKKDYNKQINETNEENKRCMFLAVENQDLKEKIEKQQKEIEELCIIKNSIQTLETHFANDDTYYVIAKKNFLEGDFRNLLDDYISKDKIKEKIDLIDKEYAEIIEKNKNDLYLVNINAQRHSAMQSILEELLGE